MMRVYQKTGGNGAAGGMGGVPGGASDFTTGSTDAGTDDLD